MRRLLLAASAAALLSAPGLAAAQDELTFALVPKDQSNPFFVQSQLGCEKADAELDDVVCEYIGPSGHDEAAQVQLIQDLITRGIDGLAVSPSNAPAIAGALQAAADANIPVITFDADLLPEDAGMRAAYVGTHNYDIGTSLAQLVKDRKPDGGTFAIISGGAAASNHNERMAGIRDTLRGSVSSEAYPGPKVNGEAGWTEVETSPAYSNDDFPLSVQQLQDISAAYPDLDAIIVTGAFPHLAPQAYEEYVATVKDRMDSGDFILVVADTLDVQMDFLRRGLVHGLVGQRPSEMGYRAMYILRAMVRDGTMPDDPTYTGLDVCTQENVDTCLGG